MTLLFHLRTSPQKSFVKKLDLLRWISPFKLNPLLLKRIEIYNAVISLKIAIRHYPKSAFTQIKLIALHRHSKIVYKDRWRYILI